MHTKSTTAGRNPAVTEPGDVFMSTNQLNYSINSLPNLLHAAFGGTLC